MTSGDTSKIEVPFLNTGSINVQSGTLEIDGGGSSALSAFNISSGAILAFSGNSDALGADTFTLISGGTLAGTGTFAITGATVSVGANNVTVSQFEEDTGILSGSGIFTVTGTATFANGGFENLMTGSGEMVLQGSTSIAESVGLDAGWELQNQGTITWTGGDIYIGYNEYGTSVGGGKLDNASGATLDIELGSTNLAVYDRGSTGTGVFTNEGTIIQSATTATTQFLDLTTFQNTGTVEVQTGALDITNAATGAGGYQIGTSSSTATLEFDSSVASGANVTFEGASGTLLLLTPSNFNGVISATGTLGSSDVLDLRGFASGSDTIHATTGAGSFNGTDTTLTVSDVTAGHTATIFLTLQNDYSGDTWTVTSDTHGGFNIADPPPAPVATIVNGASLDIDTSSSENVNFTGGTGSLVLNDPESYTGQIVGFTGTAPDAAHSDTVDLVGMDFNSAHFAETYNSVTGLLSITDGTHSADITFDDFNATLDFTSDGNGGTLITDPPGPVSSGPAAHAASDLGMTFDHDRIELGGDAPKVQSEGQSDAKLALVVQNNGNDTFDFHHELGAEPGPMPQTESHETDYHPDMQLAQQLASLITPDPHSQAVFELIHNDILAPIGPTPGQIQHMAQSGHLLH